MRPKRLSGFLFRSACIYPALRIFMDLALVSRLKELLNVGLPLPTVFKCLENLGEWIANLLAIPEIRLISIPSFLRTPLL